MPIRRADRLFDILRILRSAKAPVTAASIADELEVTVRTVYRKVGEMELLAIPGWEAVETPKGRTLYRPMNGVVSDADVSRRIDFCRDGMVAFSEATSPRIRFGGDA